jgi:hypothetical protein
VQHPAAAFGRGQDRTGRALCVVHHTAPPCEGIALSGSPVT